jgi:hypothetical protein
MDKKYYAFAEHDSIQAMLHSLYRLQTFEQAQMITNQLAEKFILAPKFSDPTDKKSFVLFVRDLMTPEQSKLGYLGNFGKISIHKLPGGKWTLTLTVLDVPLKKHPKRKTVPRPHPNMGHPLLRSASRNKTWPTMQAANADLMKLHEEFPEISVPGVNRLRIMTYIKAEKGTSPIQRLELNVVKRDEGVYAITIKNMSKTRRQIPPQQPSVTEDTVEKTADTVAAPVTESSDTPDTPPQKPDGFYADLVTKRRKRKKK